MEEKNFDIIVVAREGYQALLNVGQNVLEINCYKAINLSKMFSEDILKNCTSLSAHLEDGNLVHYKGETLPKDPWARQVTPLVESTSTQIATNYTQSSDSPQNNYQVKTAVNIDAQMKEDIRAGVTESRKEILTEDEKLMDTYTQRDIIDSGARPKQGKVLSPEKLKLKVTMDIDPKEFKKRQKDTHERLLAKDKADDNRAAQDIAAVNNPIDNNNN